MPGHELRRDGRIRLAVSGAPRQPNGFDARPRPTLLSSFYRAGLRGLKRQAGSGCPAAKVAAFLRQLFSYRSGSTAPLDEHRRAPASSASVFRATLVLV